MSFLQNLDSLEVPEIYPAIVRKLCEFCATNKPIQADECELISLALSQDVETKLSKTNISDQTKRIVTEAFQVKRRAILAAALDRIVTNNSQQRSKLKTFDWSVSMVLETSQARSVMQPLLKLTLVMANGHSLVFELTTTELDSFISTLEEARRSCTELDEFQ